QFEVFQYETLNPKKCHARLI
ncbi:TPA: hypothetical protein ACHK36_RS22175, partial [Escherichia coli]